VREKKNLARSLAISHGLPDDRDGDCDDYDCDHGMGGTTTTTTAAVRDYTIAVTYVSTILVPPPKPADNDNAALYVCARGRRSCVRCGAGPLRCGARGGDMRERLVRVRPTVARPPDHPSSPPPATHRAPRNPAVCGPCSTHGHSPILRGQCLQRRRLLLPTRTSTSRHHRLHDESTTSAVFRGWDG